MAYYTILDKHVAKNPAVVKPPGSPVFIIDDCEGDELVLGVFVVFCFNKVVVVVCKLLAIILEAKELKPKFGVEEVIVYFVVITGKAFGKKY
jgi:hypothetical protein